MGEAEEVWIKKNIGKRRELGKIIQPTVYIEFWFIFGVQQTLTTSTSFHPIISFIITGRILLKGDNIVRFI